MKPILVLVTTALALFYAILLLVQVSSSPIPAQSSLKRKPEANLGNESDEQPTAQKIRKGTRTFENENQMKQTYSEMGRKGGMATTQKWLKEAKGDPRLAKKLRSKAANQTIQIRMKEQREKTKKENLDQANEQVLTRFRESEKIAKAKGLPPAGNHQRRGNVNVTA